MAHLSSLASKQIADRYRIDLLPLVGDRQKDFETEDECRAEDTVVRAPWARAAAREATDPDNSTAALRLARKLSYNVRCGPPKTLASSLFMRGLRNGVIGVVWQMIEERVPTELQSSVTTVTISPPNSDIHEDQLSSFCAEKFLKRFRRWLYRHGAKEARGWGCFFIHCDFEPITRTFRFHLHGVVCGEMIAVLDSLRKEEAWKPIERKVGSQTKHYPRIRIKREPIINLPNALGYLLKSYWPSKWEGEIAGKAKRQAKHGRIQGHAHTRALLWLDQHSLDDIKLLVGLRVRRNGLVPSKLGYVNEKEGKMR